MYVTRDTEHNGNLIQDTRSSGREVRTWNLASTEQEYKQSYRLGFPLSAASHLVNCFTAGFSVLRGF
jgi:hypothetical protein